MLLIRGKHGVTLTEDGVFFRQRADAIVTLADRTKTDLEKRHGKLSGLIAIGATEAVESRCLAKVMAQFSREHPMVQFQLHSGIADDIKEQMDKGLLDIGLPLDPVDVTRYHHLYLAEKEIWGVLLRQDHPLAYQNAVSLKELAPYPFILPQREPVRAEIIQWMGEDGKSINNPLCYNLLSNAALLVEEGIDCAVCLNGALAVRSHPGFRYIPITSEHTTRSLLIWKKDYQFSSAVSIFIQFAVQCHDSQVLLE